jgi:hypothetical protein
MAVDARELAAIQLLELLSEPSMRERLASGS